MSRNRTLKEQIYDKLTQMISFGESKAAAKSSGTDGDRVFSISTYKTYRKHAYYFADWLKANHPEVTNLHVAKRYVPDWLEYQVNRGLSAYTVSMEASAMNKLFGIKETDKEFFIAPTRKRQDIKRSRGEAARDKHFSEKNNEELIHFCCGTGLRRSELEKLKGRDLRTREELEKVRQTCGLPPEELRAVKDALMFDATFYLRVTGKGGRLRYSPIIGNYQDKIVERIIGTPEEQRVWLYVNTHADIHSYRAEYATAIYKSYARPIEDIPYRNTDGRRRQREVYVCRKDEAGKKLDKVAMLYASKALGHNRIDVVAVNYLRNL